MEFLNKEAKKGDIVRVLIKDKYHHYGIYIGDDRIIEFGSKRDIFQTSKENIRVKEVSVKEFLDNGYLEVSSFSIFEKLKKNKPEKIVSLAKGRIGEGGYNIVENNCEHFCYEVVFNRHYSSEAELYKKK